MNPQSLQLNDIHLPSDPSIWPLALGWWIALALVIVMLVWLFFAVKKYIAIRKHKRLLFNELTLLENKLKQNPSVSSIAETNVLLRRIALAYLPDSNVASLTGSEWLAFLDSTGNTNRFTQGAGRILIEAPYRSGGLDNYNDAYNDAEFIPLIRAWVARNAQKVGGCL